MSRHTRKRLEELHDEAFSAKADPDGFAYFSRENVRAALGEIERLRGEVASLKNDIDEALEAVRLHEKQAHERRDVAEELEWRIRGNRLAAAAAM